MSHEIDISFDDDKEPIGASSVRALQQDISKVITYYRKEHRLMLAEYLGVLECIKHDLIAESKENQS